MTIQDDVRRIDAFKEGRLATKIDRMERSLKNARREEVKAALPSFGAGLELLLVAAAVKKASAQIDVVIHAVGILYALPYILDEDEVIEGLSIGAGNAKSGFDLVTDRRIAEFKFAHWQPKGNAVREKVLFEDLVKLVMEDTDKAKYLYLTEADAPCRFLKGKSRALRLLDRNRRLSNDFEAAYGKECQTVGEFYAAHKSQVQIVDLVEVVPTLAQFAQVFQ